VETPQFDTTDVESVPLDVIPGEKTLVIGRDHEFDLDALTLTPQERTILRFVDEKWRWYQRHKRSWPQAYLIREKGVIEGLLIALDTFVTSVDAKIQLALWEDKF
jgi:hypothetical protein